MKIKKTIFSISFCLIFSNLVCSSVSASTSNEEKVIISFDKNVDYALLKNYGVVINNQYKYIPSVSTELPDFLSNILTNKSSNIKIEKDPLVSLNDQTIEKSSAIPEKDYNINFIKAEDAWNSNFKGTGVKIGIVDSGVDLSHDDLNIKGGISFVKESDGYTGYKDYNGHGTHVAGIIGAKHNGKGINGIAPEAELYAIKTFNASGETNVSEIIKSVEWAIDNKMDIINMSLGVQEEVPPLENILNIAYQKGMLVVAASGNDGIKDPNINNIDWPARYPSAIAVGAIDNSNIRANFDPKTGKYSSTGPELELVAPGYFVYSTYKNNNYEYLSGTSMAAPHVAGLAALYKQAYPKENNIQIRNRMTSNSLDLGIKGKDYEFGYGLAQYKSDTPKDLINNLPIPKNLKVFPNFKTQQIELSWDNPNNKEIIEINTFLNDKPFQKAPINNNIYTIPFNSIEKTKPYSVFIRFIDKNGKESSNSNTVSVYLANLHFTDIKSNHWAYNDIRFVSDKKWMNGRDSNFTFKPNENLTRAEAAAIMVRALDLKEKTAIKQTFKDVPTNYWAYKDIEIAKQNNIFSGTQANMFSPQKPISRGEMAVVLSRIVFNHNTPKNSEKSPFKDLKNDYWAFQDIIAMKNKGLIGGYSDNTFKPTKSITRAEGASLLSRSSDFLK